MPEIETYCHYRNIDVSSIKLLYEAWYPKRERFSKSNQHRALDDIKESIAELSYYRGEMFSPAKS
jgi:oligoribonuclease